MYPNHPSSHNSFSRQDANSHVGSRNVREKRDEFTFFDVRCDFEMMDWRAIHTSRDDVIAKMRVFPARCSITHAVQYDRAEDLRVQARRRCQLADLKFFFFFFGELTNSRFLAAETGTRKIEITTRVCARVPPKYSTLTRPPFILRLQSIRSNK